MSFGTCARQFCSACGSTNLTQLRAELGLHVPKNIDKLTLFIFPDVTLCRDCGLGHFTVSAKQLNRWLDSPVTKEPGPKLPTSL